ncbi:UNVERIFIED_CONTAM: hypothetical protein RMT77_001280 [Armadillidium vulgare]
MSLQKTTAFGLSLGIVTLILFAITINLRSNPIFITRAFFELFSTSIAHPLMHYNGTLANALQFFYLLHKTSRECKKLFTVEANYCNKESDLAKEICLEDDFIPPVGNCTVLSFGIDEELNFEDQILMGFGCKTHVFDPTSKYDDNYKLSLERERESYHAIGCENGSLHIQGLKRELIKLNLFRRSIHFVKMDLWGQEWEVLKTLLELNLIKNVHQLTFSSHFSFLKALDVGNWRNTLQDIMDTMTQMEEQGLLKTLYRETRNSLSSILLPGDDVPRPACGRFLYVRS